MTQQQTCDQASPASAASVARLTHLQRILGHTIPQPLRPSASMPCRSGFEGVNNGMMASAPGLPLWEHVAQILEDRAEPTGDAWKDGPIFMTGPRVLGEVRGPFL